MVTPALDKLEEKILQNTTISFTYIGIATSYEGGTGYDTKSILSKERSAFMTLEMKIQIYRAFVISSLLYGSETWTAYSRHERRLDIFHLRCLRKIMNIRWYDKITNSEVLQRANLPSIMGMLSSRRLRWLGHVRRMETCRIPK